MFSYYVVVVCLVEQGISSLIWKEYLILQSKKANYILLRATIEWKHIFYGNEKKKKKKKKKKTDFIKFARNNAKIGHCFSKL